MAIIHGQEEPPDVLGGYGVTCVESYEGPGGGGGARLSGNGGTGISGEGISGGGISGGLTSDCGSEANGVTYGRGENIVTHYSYSRFPI